MAWKSKTKKPVHVPTEASRAAVVAAIDRGERDFRVVAALVGATVGQLAWHYRPELARFMEPPEPFREPKRDV